MSSPLPSYLHVFAAVACDRMMSPDGEPSGFIVISRNSNVAAAAMPVAHRARLPPLLLLLLLLPPPVWTHALRHCLSCEARERPPLRLPPPPPPEQQRRTREMRTYASKREGGQWRSAGQRPSGRVRPSTHLHTGDGCVSITEGTFPNGVLRLSA